jgi:YD repeat-containing protein
VTVARGPTWTTTTLDGFGRPIATENAAGVKTVIEYDVEGRKIYQSYPFTGSTHNGDQFQYDVLGRVTRITHPDTQQRS